MFNGCRVSFLKDEKIQDTISEFSATQNGCTYCHELHILNNKTRRK